ncbi:MAG: GTPase HflX [Thaumarchaeota archaeon]|nr:GTPase HflX [Nitrososphaerota archaeon]
MKAAVLITRNREDAVGEALGLCDAAGYEPVRVMRQRYLGHPRYGIGRGALEKLQEIVGETGPDVVVYDEILKPSQNYNLASAVHMEILDRETLILEIFERRASSAESRLQVRLAQLRYEMARAKEKVRLASMGEQPGFMGIGKFGVDVYYNDIRNRMNSTRAKLEKSGRQRELHRSARRRAGFKTVSLAGYTSAGKTTLFNAMTGESNEEGDELFTTLSTTTRRAQVGGRAAEPVLVSDTVGFISKLPAYMIEAFRSTLEELGHADVIVLVVDFAEPVQAARRKIASCHAALGELGVREERVIYALNKADMVAPGADAARRRAERLGIAGADDDDDGTGRWVAVSAKTGANIDGLKDMIAEMAFGPAAGGAWRPGRRDKNGSHIPEAAAAAAETTAAREGADGRA